MHSRPTHRERMEITGTANEMQCTREKDESTIMMSVRGCELTNLVLMQETKVRLLVAVLDSARLASLVRRRGWQHVLAATSIACDRIGRERRLVKRRGDGVSQELVGGGEAEKRT